MLNLRLCARMFFTGLRAVGVRCALKTVRFFLWAGFTELSLKLDELLYPEFRRIEVRKPVFILGHPRSGTTFLHRLLTSSGELCTFKLWEIFVPSIVVRRAILAVARRVPALDRALTAPLPLFCDGGHQTGAESIEEEELLLVPIFESQFSWALTPLAFDDRSHLDLVYGDALPESRRRRATAYLRALMQRQIQLTGRSRIVAKMPFSTLRIRSLMEEFPDARFIYLERDPLETIPSHLSLHRSYFEYRWGLDNIPRDRLFRYYRRRYRANVALYRYFHELQGQGLLPPDRVMVVPYERLRTDLERCIQEVSDFAGLELSEAQRRAVHVDAARQSAYRRVHENLELAAFGLSEARLRRDLPFIAGQPAKPVEAPKRPAVAAGGGRIRVTSPRPAVVAPLAMVLPLLLLLSGCGMEGSGDEVDPAQGIAWGAVPAPWIDGVPVFPPAPAFGWQIITAADLLAPGQEQFYCQFATYRGESVGFYEVTAQQSRFGHHSLILKTKSVLYADDELIKDCTFQTQPEILGQSDLLVSPEGEREDYLHTLLPEGMAIALEPGDRILYQGHYMNSSDQYVRVRDALTLAFKRPEEVQIWAAPLGIVMQDIDLPPGEETAHTIDCRFDRDYNVLYLAGHMHWNGRWFRIDTLHDGISSTLYAVDPWQLSYQDNPPLQKWDLWGYEVKRGDIWRTTCDWYNPTDAYIQFPDEMCAVFGLVYPTRRDFECAN